MAQANRAPLPRPPPDARELARLRQQNARLNAEVDARRREQRRVQQLVVAKKPLVVAQPFEYVDPRCKPQIGTKVLPPLTPPLLLGRQMGAAIAAELKAMAIEARTLVRALVGEPDVQSAMDIQAEIRNRSIGVALVQPRMAELSRTAMDSVADDAQRRMNSLQGKWKHRFEMLAEQWTRRMIAGVVAQSNAQLNLGLKDMAERLEIQSSLQSPRMRAIVEAASQASVGLITRIPEKFLGAVQTAVMSAITTGTGLGDLVPYLTKKYKGDARHAHLTALDQIRKVSESVNATRLQSLGVEEYVWIHTGGERYPRKLHQSYSGRTFRYDDPPIIDEKTAVRGKPGDAIGCRCRQRAVLNFTKMRETA
jgi:hypothetical protein